MSRTGWIAAALVAGGLAGTLAAGPVAARGGGSSYGDSYHNDMQRNPRLIEPSGENGRYLAYYGRRGYDDRRAAEAYGRAPYRGNVVVRPYGY